MTEEVEPFDFGEEDRIPPEEALVVAVDGFEGPLDLLLRLARDQKVDVAKISVLRLADQYLEFMETARRKNLELAADYLVMASWLAYLKSKLILPQPSGLDGEPTADEMAARLRWRLKRLEVMREASARLMASDRLDRDVFARGAPEPVNIVKLRTYRDTLYDLLSAYATERVRHLRTKIYQPVVAPVLAIEEARLRLERLLGKIPDWNTLGQLLPPEWTVGARRRSALASTLLACLELARDGRVVMRQVRPFDIVYVKDSTLAPTGEALA